ncbi:MAG TPA: transglutaminase domain-containing protein [Phnomibacter sp.]|nr:transglutaminase domain-containing protein [Phnomibacter sp.]
MRHLLLAITLALFNLCALAQTEDDTYVAALLKKQFPTERYGASNVTEEFRFERGKGLDDKPVVKVLGSTEATFVALNDGAAFPYYQFYNNFVSLSNFNYYYRNRREKFVKLNAIRAIDKPMTDDGIFLDDNRVKYYPVRLRETGEAARFEFNELYSDSKYFTRVFMHAPFAQKEHVVKMVIPAWLQIDIQEMNFTGFKITKQQETKDGNKVITYTIKDAEPMKSEPNAVGIAYYWPHLIVTVKKWNDGTTEQQGFESTADLYKWYKYLYDKCKNDATTLKPLVTQLTTGKTSPEEKAKALYYWVQDNIRYIAFEDGYAGFVPTAAQDVLKSKYGDCKGMANLLTEMLKLAGLDAHFTWVGTRSIPYTHKQVNTMCVDNHAISCLYIGGKPILLDATEKFGPFGEYAYRISGKTALVEKGTSFEIIDIPEPQPAANRMSTKATFTPEGTNLKGKINITLTGEMRTSFNQVYYNIPSHRQKDYLKNLLSFGNSNIEVKNSKLVNGKNRDLPVIIEGEVVFTNQISTIGKEQFTSIDYFPMTLRSYKPTEKRRLPFDLDRVCQYDDDITYTIPANMKFVDVPEALKVQQPNYQFDGKYVIANNSINLKKELRFNNPMVKPVDFAPWASFLDQLKAFNRNLLSTSPK